MRTADHADGAGQSRDCSPKLLADAQSTPAGHPARTDRPSNVVLPEVTIDGAAHEEKKPGLLARAWGYAEGSAEIAASAAAGAGSFLYHQVTEHPLRTAGFVVGGAALVAAAPLAGALGAGAAVVAGVEAGTYGVLTVASADAIVTGGEQIVNGVSKSAGAMGVLTNPESSSAQRSEARQTVAEEVGPGVATAALGTVGGLAAGARATTAFGRMLASTANGGSDPTSISAEGAARGQDPTRPQADSHAGTAGVTGETGQTTPVPKPESGGPQTVPSDHEIALRMARGQNPFEGMTDDQIDAYTERILKQPFQAFSGAKMPDNGTGAELWKFNEQRAGSGNAPEAGLLSQARSWIGQNLPKNLVSRSEALDKPFPGGPTQYVDEGQYAIAPISTALSTDNIQSCMAGVVVQGGKTLLFHAREFDHYTAVEEAIRKAGMDPATADVTLLTGNRMTATLQNILPAFRDASGHISNNIKVIPFSGGDAGAFVVQDGKIYAPAVK
jgi:hypothetical protein